MSCPPNLPSRLELCAKHNAFLGLRSTNDLRELLDETPLELTALAENPVWLFLMTGLARCLHRDCKTWYSNDPNLSVWSQMPANIAQILYFDKKLLVVSTLKTMRFFKVQGGFGNIHFEIPRWQLDNMDGRNTFCTDRSGNFWFSDFANGLMKFSPSNAIFEHYLAGVSVMNRPVSAGNGGYFGVPTPRRAKSKTTEPPTACRATNSTRAATQWASWED